jgi:hypothetical protein
MVLLSPRSCSWYFRKRKIKMDSGLRRNDEQEQTTEELGLRQSQRQRFRVQRRRAGKNTLRIE